jgi:hypothetical protein
MTTQRQRLEKLEEQMTPNAEPIIIDVVFVDAAKQKTGGFQVKIPMSGYPRYVRQPAQRIAADDTGETK